MRTLFWLVVLIGAGAVFAFGFFMSAIDRPGPLQQDRAFMVERGATGASIATALEEQGVINDELLFRLANRLAGNKPVQAGEYAIPARASVGDIVEMMTSGAALQHALTFPEGITIRAAMKIIEESDVLTGDMPQTPP